MAASNMTLKEYYSKMEVPDLRMLSKQRGISGYSRKLKAQLIEGLIEFDRRQSLIPTYFSRRSLQSSNILDTPVPDNGDLATPLTPSKYVSRVVASITDNLKEK